MATECYALAIQGTVNGQYRENIIHFKGVGVGADDTLVSGALLITGWQANFLGSWLAMMPQTYFLDRLETRRVQPTGSFSAHHQFQAFTQPGTFSSNCTSYNLCPSVLLVPPMGVKSGNRCFLPAVPDGGIVNNQYQTAYTTAINNHFNALIAGFTASGVTWTLAIFSKKLGSFSDCTGFQGSARLGFQGRRRSPVGG